MNQIRMRRESESPRQPTWSQQGSVDSPAKLHPYSFAMERLKEGEIHYLNGDWRAAKRTFAEAANTLEQVSLCDQRVLKHCFQRLALVNLRCFDLFGSIASFLHARTLNKRHHAVLSGEAELIMDRIRSARKSGSNAKDEWSYSPNFYTGHL